MPEGLVIRALSGFYDVVDGDGTRRCRARGVFRKRGITVLVGDRVLYDPVGLTEGVVHSVLDRRTELVRPPVANVDQALLVFSLHSPEFHPSLLDRALVATDSAGINPIIVITKCDLGTSDEVDTAATSYRQAGYTVLPVSSVQNDGLHLLHDLVRGQITVFIGPSGVGKSTLGNALSPELGLRMGAVSEKIQQGRHTTRHVELYQLDPETYVVDAPGFSQLEITLASTDLRLYFPEFRTPMEACMYRGCLHVEETDCGVKAAVDAGTVAAARYKSYRQLYLELRHKELTRF